MRSEKSLNRVLRTALRTAKVSQKDIADHLGFQAHSAISRKLRGIIPWSYEEVRLVSELLRIDDIAGDKEIEVLPRNKVVGVVVELLNSLSEDALYEVVYVFHLLLKDRIGARKTTALNALSIIAEKRGKGS